MTTKNQPKIKVSIFLLTTFVCLLLVLIAILFAGHKVVAPGPTPTVSNQPVATVFDQPVENNYSLVIDKIGVSAPIIINVDGNDKEAYNKALEGGVAHLLGSALPGKVGNVFIFGHSSYYAWKPGDYKEIFKKLNDLDVGDQIIINSNLSSYIYKVSDKQVVGTNDVSVANQNFNEKKLTLMTCWPIGSTDKRLVVIAGQE